MSKEDDEEQIEDVNCSAPPPSQPGADSDYVMMPTPSIQRQQHIPYGLIIDSELDVDLRPQVIAEAKTRLQMRMTHSRFSKTKVIDFRGDQHGASETKNLLYSPNKLRWKGKDAVNENQLEFERQQKISKLKVRKGTGVAQV
ncbi:60S ribosomal protein L32 [Datura stramonium]|uniref:60S ribosomal protein L32 n=1 Tax=Datura stramonium TaxID=4076 RepID=A0ABS8UQG2_DATST|nr:60S ribosomal protein L32 [Datura stramonium]